MKRNMTTQMVFLIIISAALILSSCTSIKKDSATPTAAAVKTAEPAVPTEEAEQKKFEELILNASPLCEGGQIELEFKSIDIAYLFISRYSIFREKVKDPSLLSQKMLERTFQFLSKPTPTWAKDILSAQSSLGEFKPGAVAEAVYNELTKDPIYKDLTGVSGKNTFVAASINALIKTVEDPFAAYTKPENWLAGGRQEEGTGQYKGLGVTVSQNERGEIKIESVMTGEPAERAGIGVGDAIVLVNGKKTNSCSIPQFKLATKGSEDPNLTILLRKKRTGKLEEIKVTLDNIELVQLHTCPSYTLPNSRSKTEKGLAYNCPLLSKSKEPQSDVLYIKIDEFSFQVSQDIMFVLENTDFSKVRGIIFDVRGNPGGFVQPTVDIIDYILKNQDLVINEDRAVWLPFLKKTVIQSSAIRQNSYNIVPSEIPMAVLIDSQSFSGAEVFAGALQDHGRAVLISRDDRTGGKGTVNQHYELDLGNQGNQGALYIATGIWKTPKGYDISKQDLDKDGFEEVGGLKPDIRVEFTDEDYVAVEAEKSWYDPVIFAAIEYMNSVKVK